MPDLVDRGELALVVLHPKAVPQELKPGVGKLVTTVQSGKPRGVAQTRETAIGAASARQGKVQGRASRVWLRTSSCAIRGLTESRDFCEFLTAFRIIITHM